MLLLQYLTPKYWTFIRLQEKILEEIEIFSLILYFFCFALCLTEFAMRFFRIADLCSGFGETGGRNDPPQRSPTVATMKLFSQSYNLS